MASELAGGGAYWNRRGIEYRGGMFWTTTSMLAVSPTLNSVATGAKAIRAVGFGRELAAFLEDGPIGLGGGSVAVGEDMGVSIFSFRRTWMLVSLPELSSLRSAWNRAGRRTMRGMSTINTSLSWWSELSVANR